MSYSSAGLFKLLGLVAWTFFGFCAGGVTGAEYGNWQLADVTRRLPPPQDATWPMELIIAITGAAIGAILAWVSGYFFLAKRFRVPEGNS